MRRIAHSHQDADDEEARNDEIAAAMHQANRLRPCSRRDVSEIPEAEDRREQSADNASDDVPEADIRERRLAIDKVNDVEDNAGREQAEWKNNKHWMYGMSKELCT